MTDEDLLRYHSTDDPGAARIELFGDTRGEPVAPELYGKFSEHLAWNVYHGIDAQLVYNPTFGRWRFRAENPTPDGGFVGSTAPERRTAMVEEHAEQNDYPGADRLREAVEDGLSFWWMRQGDCDDVAVSPDVGEHGTRAQRVEVTDASPDRPRGIVQWLYLPLQRTETYEYSVTARARADTSAELTLALHTVDDNGDLDVELVATPLEVPEDWTTWEGVLEVPAGTGLESDGLFGLSFLTEAECDVVLDRAVLYPDDHVDGADPDVVEFFRDADLPLLRWPGGNFASDYDWRDGIGPVDERPTTSNPAWGGVEPNLFGTMEFMTLCENVGCEPLVCLNAGTGTPEEAAKWVEYCNGDPDETEMGALRARHGHSGPFDVQYWEVGNELYGRWQPNWTTPDGNVDRYKRFRDAIHDVDPDVKLLATGRQGEWNDRLVSETGSELRSVTDHALVGPTVEEDDDRDSLYHALMAYTEVLDRRHADLAEQMRAAGVETPRTAITELQLTVTRADGAQPVLSPPWRGSRHHDPAGDLPGKKSVAEAVWDASIVHNAIRGEGGVELITHTGSVNHGGGLQKRKERVWADPCHYGHAMGSALFGKQPLGVDVACETVSTDAEIDGFGPVDDLPVLDAIAAVDDDELALVVVHRGSGVGDIETRIDTGGLTPDGEATATTLTGDSMASENTLDEPENVTPDTRPVTVRDGELSVSVPEYGLVRIVAPR